MSARDRRTPTEEPIDLIPIVVEAGTEAPPGRGSNVGGVADSNFPSATAISVAARSPWNRIINGWVSGSPNRQLNSSTCGPFGVSINPAYSSPRYGISSRFKPSFR